MDQPTDRPDQALSVRAPLRVIFACVHNAGRSQMAAALFNRVADPRVAVAESAGTAPADRVHPEVAAAMAELGIGLSAAPQRLTAELAAGAAWLITMGCGDACPVVPGARRDDWPLPDPKGSPIEEVRVIRDEIGARVGAFYEGMTAELAAGGSALPARSAA